MTRDEFDSEFWPFVRGAFPGLDQWRTKLGPEREDQQVTLWRGCFASIDLVDAKAAVMELFESVEKPLGYGNYPGVLKGIARRLASERRREHLRPRLIDGEEAYRCALCRDDGWVTVWPDRYIALAAAGRYPETKPLPNGRTYQDVGTAEAMPCSCEAGELPARVHKMERYSPQRHCLIKINPGVNAPRGELSDIERLLAFASLR